MLVTYPLCMLRVTRDECWLSGTYNCPTPFQPFSQPDLEAASVDTDATESVCAAQRPAGSTDFQPVGNSAPNMPQYEPFAAGHEPADIDASTPCQGSQRRLPQGPVTRGGRPWLRTPRRHSCYWRRYFSRPPFDFDRLANSFDQVQPLLEAVTGRLIQRASRRGEGMSVLDIACGTGKPGLTLAASCPGVHLLGVDKSDQRIDIARAKADAKGLSGARFEVMSSEQLAVADGDVAVSVWGCCSSPTR
jgi:Methyltransferase domain